MNAVTDGKKCTEELRRYSGVWVYAEWRSGKVHDVSHELLSIGRLLADKRGVELSAVLLGSDIDDEAARELVAYGADVVYVVDRPELVHFTDERYSKCLIELVNRNHPEILLAGATSMGRSFIPRVAASLRTGISADCTQLDIGDDGLLLQTKPAFGGNIMATIVCPKGRPQIATVRPKVMKPVKVASNKGRIERVALPDECFKARVEVLEVISEQDQTAKLAEADIIVAGGRGLRNGDNFCMIKELATLVDGAVGASRGAVEDGWTEPSHQVGQTGRTVAPALYMAVGISGAVHHLVGMQGSQVIVAVNKDSNAPIFDVATYGVVADLFEFIPAFMKRIKRERGL